MRNLIKLFLGKKFYNLLKILYYSLYEPKLLKSLFWNPMQDLRYNEDIFAKLEFNVEGIKSELANNNMDYFNDNISWQHHIFLGLKLKNPKEKMNILEIGTFDGNFTNFLSNNFSASNIFSIDLPQDDKIFLTSYDRDNAVYLKEFLLKRDKNISNNNITFLPSDSISLIEKFEKNFFDMIFVDGDHLNPQVTIDIFTSTLLLKKEGVLVCDDIIFENYKKNYASNEAYLALQMLEKKNLLTNFFLVKRIRTYNAVLKKHVSISYKK